MDTADVHLADPCTTDVPQFGEGAVSGGRQTQIPTPSMAITMRFCGFRPPLQHASKAKSTQRTHTEQIRSAVNDRQ